MSFCRAIRPYNLVNVTTGLDCATHSHRQKGSSIASHPQPLRLFASRDGNTEGWLIIWNMSGSDALGKILVGRADVDVSLKKPLGRRVEEGRGLGTKRNRPVSPPRSSNWTCPFRTSSFPTGFTAAPTRAVPVMVPGDDTEDCSLRTATQRDREVVRIAAVL